MEASWSWEWIQWHLDPVLVWLGPLPIRWYGIMYVVAFAVSHWLATRRIASGRGLGIAVRDIDDALTWMVVGVLVGGRLGYALFYNLPYFLEHPLEVVLPFRPDDGWAFTGFSGMSFHGGLLGFAIATLVFCRKRGISALALSEVVVPGVPLGYMFGRLGNFINGELWGRTTTVPWALRFPEDHTASPPPLRHPSQLYEAFGEGLLLWAILHPLRDHPFFQGRMLGSYLIGYGAIRFVVEFTREPDAQLGLVLGPFSMGQILCVAMIAIGSAAMVRLRAPRPT